MLVRNWMQRNPIVVGSDTLVHEAKQIITDNNLHGLPVVDDGRLRGLITRAICLRAAHYVLRTQDADEQNYFSTRVKVKDLMVRNPVTIQASDTMEHCLEVGIEHGIAQLPVMEDGRVVGIISANEMFALAAHFLSAWEKRSGVTLAPMDVKPGTIGRIADIVEAAGAELQAIYPIGKPTDVNPRTHPFKRVVIRFHSDDTGQVVAAIERAGFQVIESVQATRPMATTDNTQH
ncbi:MAG: CBS domain-containing protein [Rhodocyclaceae bacterium]|nr:CBS domain-containing protein [Rhodocyclaceae bacterium]MCC8998916.1 CBS domain-containing protein [Candidatus Contendobacter sp.]MBK6553736.1 CBS domain-containing protein [Rhodocyclaceae bacterium]MBK6678325.1 CBS domain-containing protein [Rhodocyclaceae bacterium]MBK7813628.1 CBS domain-containing protein [Rhodocyclaceae bacterium]